MCGGGVRSILPLVATCLETIDVCIWRMLVFMSVVVTVLGSVGMFVVQRLLLKIVSFFSLGVLKCLCRGCDECCVFYLYCEVWNCFWTSLNNIPSPFLSVMDTFFVVFKLFPTKKFH